jgi:hypothetical protein
LGDVGINERIILKFILKKQCVKAWTGLILLKVDSCEHGTEHSDFIKDGDLLDQLSDYQLAIRLGSVATT